MEMSSSRPGAGSFARTATLQSIAEATGVHRSTAARALDSEQSHRISPDVVKRIQDEARRQGYRRDAIAASLRTGRSRLIGVVLPDLTNPVFGPIMAGISEVLTRERYSLIVADGGGTKQDQLRIVEELIARRIDGLVLATAQRRDPVVTLCLKARVPIVLTNRAEDRLRVPTVVSDDTGGMRLAVQHLVSLGHQRIGHLAGPEELSTGILRRKGFEAAMRLAKLDSSAVTVSAAYSRSAGREATAALLARAHNLTAIVASNDLIALGAYGELNARGIKCPDDLSIVGHNDMPLVDMVSPSLTTIRIEHAQMGQEAARLLMTQLSDRSIEPTAHLTEPKLIVRGSSAPPAKMVLRKTGVGLRGT
jgi:LacI family transcriptional regulator